MSKQPAPVENQKSKIENGDIWSRLRESMEKLATIGQQKTDPARLAKRLSARAKQLRGRMTTAEPAEAPLVFLAFNKGSQRYGIPVDDVIEVQALDYFSPVPRTPPFISGVIHWRGDVLALLDIGRLFGIPESGLADVHVCLIVEGGGHRVALVVTEIEEIYAVPKSEIKTAPELPGNIPQDWILGVHDNNRMILKLPLILQDARLVDWRTA